MSLKQQFDLLKKFESVSESNSKPSEYAVSANKDFKIFMDEGFESAKRILDSSESIEEKDYKLDFNSAKLGDSKAVIEAVRGVDSNHNAFIHIFESYAFLVFENSKVPGTGRVIRVCKLYPGDADTFARYSLNSGDRQIIQDMADEQKSNQEAIGIGGFIFGRVPAGVTSTQDILKKL